MSGSTSPTRPSSLRVTAYASSPGIQMPSPIIKKQRNSVTSSTTKFPVPPIPPSWKWTCHQCYSTYPLGATRRCLHDGHRFCAGVTHNRHTGKLRKHTACGSTFDYAGWKAYNEWRLDALAAKSGPSTPACSSQPYSYFKRRSSDGNSSATSRTTRHKNCERQCNFPSECRWNPQPLKTSARKKKRTRIYDDWWGQTNSNADEYELLSSLKESLSEPALSPVSPPSPSPVKTSDSIQPLDGVEYRAPVLGFTEVKARLDMGVARDGQTDSLTQQSRRPDKRGQLLQLELPELDLSGSTLMDFDTISPREELPENKGIQVAIPIRERGGLSAGSTSNRSHERGAPQGHMVGMGLDSGHEDFDSSSDSESETADDASLFRAVETDEVMASGEQAELRGTKRKESCVPVVEAAWDWSLGGLDAKLTGMGLAGAVDISDAGIDTLMDEDDIA